MFLLKAARTPHCYGGIGSKPKLDGEAHHGDVQVWEPKTVQVSKAEKEDPSKHTHVKLGVSFLSIRTCGRGTGDYVETARNGSQWGQPNKTVNSRAAHLYVVGQGPPPLSPK